MSLSVRLDYDMFDCDGITLFLFFYISSVRQLNSITKKDIILGRIERISAI